MNRNREVVILKNVKSDYIEEAILILKDGSAKDRGKALKEAEKLSMSTVSGLTESKNPLITAKKRS